MKRYQDYKESGIDWIGEIPKDWEMTVLKRSAYLKGRIGWQGLTSEEYEREGEYALVTGTEFQDGRVDWNNCWFIDQDRYQEDPYIQLQKDDLLITKDGTIGKIAHIDQLPKPATLNSGVFVLRPLKNSFVPRFMFWALRSDLFPQYIEYSKVGTTISHLYQKTFERFIYPLPSQDEQKRISSYLDKQCADIDNILEIKKEQLSILEALRKSIIHKAVTKGLDDSVGMVNSRVDWFGDIPRTWCCGHLKRFANRIQAGVTPPTETADYYFDGTVQWFTPSSFDGHIELREPRKLINELAVRDGVLRVFPAETIFLIGIGATIGKVGIIKKPASCNQQIIGIVCTHRMNGRYLAYQMKIYEDVIPEIASATTLAIFDQVKVGYLPILQPSLREQTQISAFLDQKLAEIRQSETVINQQVDVLLDYRKSLIHECVTGKRRITEHDLKELTNV